MAEEADTSLSSSAANNDAQRMYRLELLVRDSPGIVLSDAELDRLNSRERAAVEFLQRRHAPEGVPPPVPSFNPWSPDEQLRFVHRIRQIGADSRSQRALWARDRLSEARPPSPRSLHHARATDIPRALRTQVQLAHGTSRSSSEHLLHYRLLLMHASEVVARSGAAAAASTASTAAAASSASGEAEAIRHEPSTATAEAPPPSGGPTGLPYVDDVFDATVAAATTAAEASSSSGDIPPPLALPPFATARRAAEWAAEEEQFVGSELVSYADYITQHGEAPEDPPGEVRRSPLLSPPLRLTAPHLTAPCRTAPRHPTVTMRPARAPSSHAMIRYIGPRSALA